MKQNVIVLCARGWALVDERTKQERQGVSIHYLNTDTNEHHKKKSRRRT